MVQASLSHFHVAQSSPTRSEARGRKEGRRWVYERQRDKDGWIVGR